MGSNVKLAKPPEAEALAPASGSVSCPISIAAVIADRNLLARDALTRALLVQQESGERLEAVVTRLGLISEQALSQHLAATSGLPLASAELLHAPLARDALPMARNALPGAITADFLRDVRAVPIATAAGRISIAVVDPFDPFIIQAFAFVCGQPIDRVVACASDIDAAIDRLFDAGHDPVMLDDTIDVDDMDRMRDLISDAPAIRAVNRLIAEAVDEHASDIHLEPGDDSLIVRYRVDGTLREVTRLPQAMRSSVVARIKVVAALDIAEKRLPQDGRLRVAVRGHEIDLRVATAPSIHGESVVMRILDRSNLALELGALGLDDRLGAEFRAAIHRPHGIVLVTGPTGSGKTTTLYAALAELNGVERKLLTIEDPIEYRLAGVVQTQVQPGIGFTFASALRSFLRQDPDVIMVGEIRDVETAQTAVQAALTGHMILSTLHTNTAAGAVTRLLDMAVEPFLLSSVLAGVLAQRLVRRLCMACREVFTADAALKTALGIDAGQLYRATGCPACHGSGYSGRIALFAFLPVTPEIAKLILRGADSRSIEAAALALGHRNLIAEGYGKAAQGLTTIEEVLRVASGE